MRTFDYLNLPQELFDREVGDLNALVHQDKGKMDLLKQLYPDELAQLERQAHLDNVVSSMRIEGIYPADVQVQQVIDEEARLWPQLSKQFIAGLGDAASQVAGYSHALRGIERDAASIDIASSAAVQFFEDLFCAQDFGMRSRYRKKDYVYTQVEGHMQAVPVSPIVAFETPLVFGSACDSLADAFDGDRCSPLLLAAVFMVDMLCIRPFDAGNGRVMRLMGMLLMEKADFDIFRYSSVDALVEKDAAGYYDALNACVEGWESEANDYRPFAAYWLAAVHEAYQQLFAHMDVRVKAPSGKSARVRSFLELAPSSVSKRDILKANPDISIGTVENELGRLVKEGLVRKVGRGRSTAYEWVR